MREGDDTETTNIQVSIRTHLGVLIFILEELSSSSSLQLLVWQRKRDTLMRLRTTWTTMDAQGKALSFFFFFSSFPTRISFQPKLPFFYFFFCSLPKSPRFIRSVTGVSFNPPGAPSALLLHRLFPSLKALKAIFLPLISSNPSLNSWEGKFRGAFFSHSSQPRGDDDAVEEAEKKRWSLYHTCIAPHAVPHQDLIHPENTKHAFQSVPL